MEEVTREEADLLDGVEEDELGDRMEFPGG